MRCYQPRRDTALRRRPRAWTAILVAVFAIGVIPVQSHGTVSNPCQKMLYKAAAKYSSCELKAVARLFGGLDDVEIESALSKCRVSYGGQWSRVQARCGGDTQPRFLAVNGTVTDNLTGLQWEQKTADNVDSTYFWS